MRRSSVVQLTLLPMLATAAVASMAAAEPPTAAPSDPPTAAPSMPPPVASIPLAAETSQAPGALPVPAPVYLDPGLSPPGMTPTIYELKCDEDPNWMYRADCVDEDGGYYYDGGVIRGGFGSYFYGGGG